MKRKLGLLPTPNANVMRASRRAMTEETQWSAPGLEQVAELASGILPREFESEEEIPGRSKLMPTPRASDERRQAVDHGEGGPSLPGAMHKLLPTPTSQGGGKGGSDFARSEREGSGGDDLGTTMVKLGLEAEMTLLPTPSAWESDPTEEFIEECRAAGIDPNERLYLPGRKWFSQRTLSRVVPSLLPTPQASDGSGGRFDRSAAENGWKRPSGAHATKTLSTAARLLPTPTSKDRDSSRRSTARTEEWTSNPGTTLTDAALESSGASTEPPSDGGNSSSGGLRLSPSFVEWLMGAPARWTDPGCRLSAMEFSSRPAGSAEPG